MVEQQDALGPVSDIICALLECQKVVDHIEKTGTAPAVMGGFKFAEVGQVVAAARKAMIEHGLALTASVSNQLTPHIDEQGITHVIYSFDLWHISGACIPGICSIYAHGGDRNSKGGWGDKGGNKASTAAQKYGIIRLFNIPTVDEGEYNELDSDAHSQPDVPMTRTFTTNQPHQREEPPPPSRTPDQAAEAAAPGDPIATEADIKKAQVWKTGFTKAGQFFTEEQLEIKKNKFCAIDYANQQFGIRSVKQLRKSQLRDYVQCMVDYPGPSDDTPF